MKKILFTLCLIPLVSYAEMDHSMHMNIQEKSGYEEKYDNINMQMHKDMTVKYSGNADVDFVKGMIAHHQGAVDMAKVQLEYGKDPEMRKLAENIISSQEVEIKEMKEWLFKNKK